MLDNFRILRLRTPLSRSSGFSLIEVLVAVLILGIGLLGIAGLQTAGIRYNTSAYQRYQATLLSYDILDRMRANRKQALNTTGYAVQMGENVTSSSDCMSASCTEAEMAVYDLASWKSALATNLPMGDGWVHISDSPGVRLFVITVKWDDSRGNEPPQELTMRTML
jgi:type IV pilus assembly protein PilV